MVVWDRWQAPDRDSPSTASVSATVELGTQLGVLLRMEGLGGTREDEVAQATGATLSRPRRWHKIFERMGLLYLGDDGNTHVTDLGNTVLKAEGSANREIRRRLARDAVRVLRKYQLRNPADESTEGRYPDDCDLHPYWAIWKAAVELGGRLHWDELNRVLMWVLRHSDLDAAIERIADARGQPGYEPRDGGSAAAPLGERCYDQETAPAGKDPDGQIRDQKTTPWFRRAGFGQLLLESPGGSGDGYWSIPDDMIDILRGEVERPPLFRGFADNQGWFDYYGSLEEVPAPDSIGRLAAALLIDVKELEKVTRLLDDKRQGIFYGPPGTGKTYVARELARFLAGSQERVTIVQFHPAYAYEDFVEGYRPALVESQPGFELVEGPLKRIARQAVDHPDENHVLVIDEINRGNVAKVFGELYYLLEYRGEAITLQYSREKFTLPGNLLIIATMNTADRSIALVDMALRRRFYFFPFYPDRPPIRDLLRRWLEGNNPQLAWVADVVDRANQLLEDQDTAIGPSYFMRKDLTEAWVELIWEHSVLPYIGERLYGERERLVDFELARLKRQKAGGDTQEADDATSDAERA